MKQSQLWVKGGEEHVVDELTTVVNLSSKYSPSNKTSEWTAPGSLMSETTSPNLTASESTALTSILSTGTTTNSTTSYSANVTYSVPTITTRITKSNTQTLTAVPEPTAYAERKLVVLFWCCGIVMASLVYTLGANSWWFC